MGEMQLAHVAVVAPEGAAEKITGMLVAAGIVLDAVWHTGQQAAQAVREGAVLLATWRLPDMSGTELAAQLNNAQVLMIVPQAFEGELPPHVFALRNPVSQDALVYTVRAFAHCQAQMQALRAQAERSQRQLAERKVIDRAKGWLMDTLHMSEADAHYFIQKKSMDSGRRIVDVAQEILDSQEIIAS